MSIACPRDGTHVTGPKLGDLMASDFLHCETVIDCSPAFHSLESTLPGQRAAGFAWVNERFGRRLEFDLHVRLTCHTLRGMIDRTERAFWKKLEDERLALR